MKKVFLITDDEALESAISTCTERLGAEMERSASWSSAKDALFKERYDAVCIDYEAIKIEGLDAFILLDNILQKEQTPGVLILRRASERARQFISSLDSFRDSIELNDSQAASAQLAPHVKSMLEESPAGAAEPSSPQTQAHQSPVEVEVRLPSLEEGSLDKVHLSRLLYALAQERASGILQLQNGSIERRYAIIDGRPVRRPGGKYAELETLSSAFAWQEGRYRFDARRGREADTVEPLEFIYDSLERHMPQRRVMRALMPQMQNFPAVTDRWAKRREKLADLGVLEQFMHACDGETSLERALASLGANATAGFKASLFARQTDLLVMRGKPTPEGVEIQYDSEIAQAQKERIQADKKASKAFRATGTGRLDLEEELRGYLDDIEQATPYEIFDVWEGCGRQVIQEKFYEMVKSHHPDVYGGNVSGDVKSLAQEIFIAVKDAYTELLKVEDEQTRPDPREPDDDGLEASSEAMTATNNTREVPTADASEEDASKRRSTETGYTTNDASFGAEESAAPSRESTSASKKAPEDDAARKSRLERLKAKRSATPIGLGRKPSSPMVQGKTRKSKLRKGTEERKAKIDKIRRNSTVSAPKQGSGDPKEERAKKAFNEGYKAYREAENEALAFERFSTAYNLEPDNGKYMTFYGYLLFLNNPERRDEAEKVLRKAIELGDRQSLPDAHVFLGHILKVKDDDKRALKHFKKALELNPKSREAQREIRLYHMRKKGKSKADGDSFLKNLFKK